MKKKSEKKTEPPRRSTMAELLKEMEEEAKFRVDRCPNRSLIEDSKWEMYQAYRCSLHRDYNFDKDDYGLCDFKGRDYRECPRYKACETDKKKRPSLSDLEDKV